MPARGGDVHGPVARARDVRLAAFLERLKGADLVALVVDLAAGGLHLLAEFVVQTFILEVALLLRDPLLQAEVRLDDELLVSHDVGHRRLSRFDFG